MKPGPQANAVFGYLKADEYFQHEGVVCSDDGFYTLRLNQYGQLEIWFKADGEARAIWLSSYSSSDRSYFAIMQGDGNFCVYKGTGPGRNEGLVWDARKTAAWGTNRLTLWSDGNLQLINVVAGQPITVAWETGAHDNVPHPPTRIRRNIGSSEELLFDFVRGVKMLKEIGAYDRYIRRHRDLARGSPPVIHLTPCFLPWHRLFLLDFERDMQRVLGDDTFALPYWDWTDDYGLPSHIGPLWDWDRLGGAGNPVVSGPFAFPQWHVIEDVDIKLIRGLGLPGVTDRFADKRAVRNLFALNDFTAFSEGVRAIHDYMHMWVGGRSGQMSNVTLSVNDPAFWLHHANIDRIWAQWHRRLGLSRVEGDRGLNITLRQGDVPQSMDAYHWPRFEELMNRAGPEALYTYDSWYPVFSGECHAA